MFYISGYASWLRAWLLGHLGFSTTLTLFFEINRPDIRTNSQHAATVPVYPNKKHNNLIQMVKVPIRSDRYLRWIDISLICKPEI